MVMTRTLSVAVVFASLLSSPAAYSQSLREEYDQFTQEYESGMQAWHSQYDKASTDEDSIARYRDWPGWGYAPKLIELAERAGTDSVGFDCTSRVVELGRSVSKTDQRLLPHYERSLQLLLRNHFDKDLRPLCGMVGFTEGSESFLRALVEQEMNREIRAEASFCLGGLLARKWLLALPDSWVQRPETTPFAKYVAARCRQGLRSYLENGDPDAVYAEAVQYLTIASEEFGDVEAIGGRTTLGDLAKAQLYELQYLSPGKTAPEIEGQDVSGKPMTLGEYRGNVVLLVFWASWCGPCVGDIPHEIELAERFAGRPFVIVGVNGDATVEAASAAVGEHDVPWRSFWNGKGGPNGPIANAWNVHGWPTVYVLDHAGVIKHKDLRREQLDEPLEKLIAIAESAESPR